ncbi:MAG: ABC transporter permease [Evtepia gabavorous]
MLLRALRSEGMKCRRSPVWAVFLVLPLFPAIMGTLNYLGNLEILDNGWDSLWSLHTIFSASFFMPAQFCVFCAWQWRLEHTDHNWNSLMTAPVPVRDLYWSKFLLAAGVAVLGQVCIGVLYLLSGQLAGVRRLPFSGGLMFSGPWGHGGVCGAAFLSLVIRSFAPPVALGLVGALPAW